ncbi:hypothetical protein F4212_11235 [Candidatus Poribacteria bacterium]|nr:hypothetical protein [Candidatus Poribacteria bacterium]
MNYKQKALICIPIFIVICFVLMGLFPNILSDDGEIVWWLSVLPPLIAITLAIITTRLFLSLGVAVGSGLLLSWIHPVLDKQDITLKSLGLEVVWFVRAVTVGNDGIDLFNFWVIMFVLFMMSMISVVIASGGIASVITILSHLAKGPRTTQVITAVMGTIIFIGDYSNAMLVGPTMRPITDKYKVSREKLAYIVDSTSAPIAGLAFVSTWIGYEVGLFNAVAENIGLNSDGYSMFFDALPFRFYCILTIIFVLINTVSGRDYGMMRSAQNRARDTGNVSDPDAKVMGGITSDTNTLNTNSQILSAVIPLTLLFTMILGGLWIDGNGSGSVFSLTSWRNALSEANNVKVLASSAITSFVAAILCGLVFSKMSFPQISKAVKEGLSGTLLPIAIILCAWGIKASCDRLSTGDYIASLLSDVVSPLWFPALVFVVASLTSFATGTSWGTMAILIPTAIPVAYVLDGNMYGITTIICLGAVLDGAIFGDHCSPISDTTILSAIVSSCDPMHHVRTQMPYALTVAVIALMCGYLPAALGLPSGIGILIGTGGIILLYVGLSRLQSD